MTDQPAIEERVGAWITRHPRTTAAVVALAVLAWIIATDPPVWGWAGFVVCVAVAAFPRRRLAAVHVAGELEPPNAIRDTLGRPSRALPPPHLAVDGLSAVRVGTTEAGAPWELNIRGSRGGTHVLIAGLSGAGKSSVIWSTLDALGLYIRCGMVEVRAVDPKGGQELTIGAGMFSEYECESWTAMAKLLSKAVADMKARQARLRHTSRTHVPSLAEPLVVILVDEMTVLAEIPDTKVRNDIRANLFILLAQGRAAGFCVVGAAQDIRKEKLPDRSMFLTCVGLRMEKIQVDMAFGDGAWDAGMRCDDIDEDLPGTAYVWVGRKVTKVRSYYLTDEEVVRIAQLYRRAA